LLDKSFLLPGKEEGEEPRLLMLETIREFGLEALTGSGELETVRQAHATSYLSLVEEVEPELVGPRQAMSLERLEREHDNLRAVMQWLLGQQEAVQGREMALRLGGALRVFWVVHGHITEGRHFLECALAVGVPLAGNTSHLRDF
jgi:non-specific serine/threonine protein kinase